MNALQLLFEFVPVILSIVAIPMLLRSLQYGRRKTPVLLAVIACILLIVAQTGWIQAYLSSSVMAMSVFDKVWTVFNTVVMLVFISWSNPFRKGDVSEQSNNITSKG
jgi:hypothetical protein